MPNCELVIIVLTKAMFKGFFQILTVTILPMNLEINEIERIEV